MLDRTDDSSVAADNWLAQFEEALGKPDDALLKTLFHPDSYWRDVLALSWNIQTLNGRDAILKALPGAKPQFFFAPDQIRKRASEWGPGGVDMRFGAAWSGLVPRLDQWVDVIENHGPAAVQRAYLDTLNGRVPPDQGLILSLPE